MTTQKTNEKEPNFRKGSIREAVYKLHFGDKKDVREIASTLGKSEQHIRTVVYDISKLMNGVVQEEVLVSNPTGKVLDIELKEKDEELYLYIKASKEVEEWLNKNRERKITENLWGSSKIGKFYVTRISAKNVYDDINAPLIHKTLGVNFAVLRLCGISEGIETKIDGFTSPKKLEKALQKMVDTFKIFYKEKILGIKEIVNAKAEVYVEK
jgi:hypothetical protein